MAVEPATAEPFDPEGVVWTPVSPRLATARRTVLAIFHGAVLVVITVIGLLLLPTWVWVLADLAPVALLAFGWALAGRQARAIGYAEREDDLLVRRGVMVRNLVVVPYGRMQYVDVTAGPLDRRLGLATVTLHTAAAATDASVPGLLADEAARLRDRLAALGEARQAGV